MLMRFSGIKKVLCFLFFVFCSINCFSSDSYQSNQLSSNQPLGFNYANHFFRFGTQYSSVFGGGVASQLAVKMNEQHAFLAEVDYGPNKNRIGLTWGVAANPRNFLKMTAERLAENIPFHFTANTLTENIPQYGYGLSLEHFFQKNGYLNVDFYYAQAQSKSLGIINFISNSNQYLDYEHIAGAVSKGFDVGGGGQFSKNNLWNLKINYDQVNYNQIYSLQRGVQNKHNFGITADFTRIISESAKIYLSASKRAIYNAVNVDLGLRLNKYVECDIGVNHIEANSSVPNENIYSINLKFNLDRGLQAYSAPSSRHAQDI